MFSQRLKDLRLKSDLTQKDLADFLGVTPKTISFYELGQRMPPADVLLKLSQKFNVSIDFLLSATDIPYTVDTYINKSKHIANQLTSEETNIIKLYRDLPAEAKTTIRTLVETQHQLYVKPKCDEKAI